MHISAIRLSLIIFAIFLTLSFFAVLLDYAIFFKGMIPSRHIRPIFAMTKEESYGNWLSSIFFLFLGLSCFLMAVREHLRLKVWRKLDWCLFGALFSFLSFDDGSRVHERLGDTFKEIADWQALGNREGLLVTLAESFPSYYWHIIYMPILGLAGLTFFLLLWKELAFLKPRLILLAAMSCFVFAESLDFVEGLYLSHQSLVDLIGMEKRTITHFLKVLEEFLEMQGISSMACLILWLFTSSVESLQLDFRQPER